MDAGGGGARAPQPKPQVRTMAAVAGGAPAFNGARLRDNGVGLPDPGDQNVAR
jgi:hypothetical protein